MSKKVDLAKILTLKKAYVKAMNDDKDDDKMTSGLALFVLAINEHEFSSQQQLSDYIGCNKAHTSRTIVKLLEQNLIEPMNGNKIRLTPKGRKLAQKAIEKKTKFVENMLKGVSDEDKSIFARVLDKVIENSAMYVEV